MDRAAPKRRLLRSPRQPEGQAVGPPVAPPEGPTDAPSAQQEEVAVLSGRARLATVRQGAGGTPQVVFLHTGISDKRSWDEVLDLLSPEMDVVAYDRRGFGTTVYQPEAHDQLVDLLAVLDSLELGQVVLIGNSRGGQIALDFALTHPDRVAALVLVAPAVSGAPAVDDVDIDPVEAAIWADLAAADAAGALDALNLGEIRLWLDGPHAPEGRVDGDRRQLALDMNRIALRAASPGHEPAPPLEAWTRLGEVRCPTLVVVGDLDLRHIQERCRHLAAEIPGAQLEVMEAAAHLPGLEQPAAFADLLWTFLHLKRRH
jgi:pimeloyl-ACP methyl ester carboxylesterase